LPEVGIHGKGEVELTALLEEFKRKLGDETGAIGCFIGRVRGMSNGGEPVKVLHYESSDEAARGLARYPIALLGFRSYLLETSGGLIRTIIV